MEKDYIDEIRAFNRFYTAFLGILNKHFLSSKYSLPELRVMQAVRLQEGITASEIISLLNIDKSYLSRIILMFEKQKWITKKVSPTDRRVFNLYTTALGKKEFDKMDEVQIDQVRQTLANLTDEERENLVLYMANIKEILSKKNSAFGQNRER